MSNTVESAETPATEPVVDLAQSWVGMVSAIKTLRATHAENVEAIAEKTPKAAKRFGAESGMISEIVGYIPGVKELINSKTRTIKELRRDIAGRDIVIANQQAEIDELSAEKLKLISFKRPVSVYTGIQNLTETSPVDTLAVKCEPFDVMSRIFIIVNPEAGVMGFKVFVDSNTCHVFLIPEHIGMTEIVEGRIFDVDNNANDALKVYMNVLTCAVALADAITSLYGRYNVLPVDRNISAEDERIPEEYVDMHVTEDAADAMEFEEDGDGEEGDDEDGDSPLDGFVAGEDEEEEEDGEGTEPATTLNGGAKEDDDSLESDDFGI